MIAESVASRLAGVYAELVAGLPRSEVLRLDLTKAAANGQAKRLIIAQCDSEVELVGTIRAWWLVDEAGLRRHECPLGQGLLPEEFMIESPVIRFATDGKRVRVGATFGPNWYRIKFGELDEHGHFVAARMFDEWEG